MTIETASLVGGGLPIGGVLALQVGGVDVFTSSSGEVFLKSGVFETNPAVYPDAFYGPVDLQYTGKNYTTTRDQAVAIVNGEVWTFSGSTAERRNIDTGVLIGTLTLTGLQNSESADYDPVNDVLYIFGTFGGSTNTVSKFRSDGSSAGSSISIGSPRTGITTDGDHFYLVAANSPVIIEKYDLTGTLVTSFNTGFAATLDDITYADSAFYLLRNNGVVYQATETGAITGFESRFASEDADARAFSTDGVNVAYLTDASNTVYIYDFISGNGIFESVDPDTQLPIYVKVK